MAYRTPLRRCGTFGGLLAFVALGPAATCSGEAAHEASEPRWCLVAIGQPFEHGSEPFDVAYEAGGFDTVDV